MSESDEPEPKTRKRRRRRRSLRVPVDEVPRPTQAGEGGATLEIPPYDDGRATLREASDGEPSERELPEEIETFEELDEELLGAPRDGASAAAPLEAEPTIAQEAPSELAAQTAAVEAPLTTAGGAAEAREPEAPSLEVELDDGDEDDEEEAEDVQRVASNPAPPEPARPPIVGVIVQRVVSVASAPRSSPPPPPEAQAPQTDTHPGAELAVDIDDPELRVTEPDAADLEELDVELEESTAAAAETAAKLEVAPGPQRDSAPELALEDADALLEEDEARSEEENKRPSVRPPPPPSSKATPPPVEPTPPPSEAPALTAPPSATVKKKRPRRQWWEELFNDEYLRTVPIPHPRVIERQCDFIEQRFGLAPGATLLDVGCGLGLHAVELTRRGYLVVGLDLSLPMLARAADEAQDHGFKINFLHADMREMTFDGAFDAVVCYGTTFGYFDDETNKLVVERLYRALKPRGLLLLDVVNRDFLIRNQPNLVWFEGDGCVVMEESQMNYITSRLEVKRTVILDNGRQRENVYSLRSYSLHELGQILHHQGFRVVEVTGWEAHPGVFFGADSPKLIILAERRPQGPPSPPSRSPSGEMHALEVEPDEAEGAEDVPDAPEPALDGSKEPSAAVSEALADAFEQPREPEASSQGGEPEPDELDPEELAEDDLEEPED